VIIRWSSLRMLEENAELKFIASVTGLSTEQILKLKNKL